MARQYGLPFKGSKSKIAEDIIRELPPGRRLVDLFGGGFAISHCALEQMSGMFPKWESVLYNDIDPLLPPLIKRAIDGFYGYGRFKPEFITSEMFHELKGKEGYVKFIWSFGNNGRSYLFGKGIEPLKHMAHDYVVFGVYNPELKGLIGEARLTGEGVRERRLEYKSLVKKNGKRLDLQRLEQLERLQRLEQLERLELSNISYEDYEYRDGDVIYCDIPYEHCDNAERNYGCSFSHGRFWKWADSRPFPVYVSEYARAEVVWQKQVVSVMNSGIGRVSRNEVLYRAGGTGDR